MNKLLAASISALMLATQPVFAGDVAISTQEAIKVGAALAELGCSATNVEKEDEGLYEIDDASCGANQYDMKLDSKGHVIVMTFDGQID